MALPAAFSWIRSGSLAIAGLPGGDAWPLLQDLGVASVLSCCDASEAAWSPPPALWAARVPLPDHRRQRPLSPELLEQAVEQGLALMGQQPALLVHCFAGAERAPLLAVALLCRSEGLDLFTALEQVRRAHPQAQPLREHLVLLERWLAAGPRATP